MYASASASNHDTLTSISSTVWPRNTTPRGFKSSGTTLTDAVPGVFFCNRRVVMEDGPPHIMDMAPTILRLFGLTPPVLSEKYPELRRRIRERETSTVKAQISETAAGCLSCHAQGKQAPNEPEAVSRMSCTTCHEEAHHQEQKK